MGKSHKTGGGGGGGHLSKKPISAKKKDKEKDKSNKEKKVVKGNDAKHKSQKSPKSATAKKKGAGDGKSDKSKKPANSKPKSGKPKSGKEKSGKEKTPKQCKPPVPKKEEPVESGTSTAEEVDEVEVAAPPAKPKVAKGAPKKTIQVEPESSEPADCSCETKQSSGGGQQSSAAASTAASSAAADETTKEGDEASSSAEETSDDAEPPKAAAAEKKKKQNHKSKQPKEKKPKSTKNSPPKLEFTKPTINQMVREEERQKHPKPPLVDTPEISRYDFEAFNDEVEEMNSGLMMLRSSYGSIITSLVAMYTKRGKRGQKAQLPPTVDGKANLLTPINAAAGADVQEEASILNDVDKYNIDNFINPATRQASFDALFAEVELLNRKTEKFRSAFFDKKGYFLLEKYEAQKEMKLSRKKLNHFWLWTRKLTEVIDLIAREYNDDLLNMFRLH